MKKRILSIALAVTMATSLFTGCGKDDDLGPVGEYITLEGLKESFQTKQELTTENIELVVWESVSGPNKFVDEAGKWFTQLYPNIKVKFVNVESTESNSQIALDGPAGNGPDLFAAAHNTIGIMAAGAHLLEIPDTETDIVKASCTDAALEGATLKTADGKTTLYGYPISVETYALFYNKDLITEEEVPKTTEELITYINTFNADSNNKGKIPFAVDAGNAYYSVMYTSNPNNHLYGPKGNDLTNTFQNSDESVAQMADFVALSKAVNMKTTDIDYKHNDSAFSGQELVLNISGAWNIMTYEENNVNFGITAIPTLTGSDQPPTNFMGVRCMFVSEYSKHKPESIAFAEFLMTKEMQKLRCEITKTMPAREDVLADIEDPLVKAYMDGLQEQIAYSYPMPNMAQASLFWTAFASAYSNIWNGEVTDIQAELDKADKTATKK